MNDEMAQVNMDFNQDVNYKGLFHLEEALLNGRPEGLKEFGKTGPTDLRRIIQFTRASAEKLVRLRPFLFRQFFRPGTRNRIQPLSPDSARCRR